VTPLAGAPGGRCRAFTIDSPDACPAKERPRVGSWGFNLNCNYGDSAGLHPWNETRQFRVSVTVVPYRPPVAGSFGSAHPTRYKLICPKLCTCDKLARRAKFRFAADPNHRYIHGVPSHSEGRLAIVRNAGRDAVDAAASSREVSDHQRGRTTSYQAKPFGEPGLPGEALAKPGCCVR